MASMLSDDTDDYDDHPVPMSYEETVQKYRQLYSDVGNEIAEKFVRDLYKYYEMFPYVDRRLVEKMIYENWYEITQTGTARVLAELEARNLFLRYSTLSKDSITNDEPFRCDMCRDEKTLDAILPTFPTDICRIVLAYGIMTVSEIVDMIQQSMNAVSTYGNKTIEHCLFPNDSAEFYIYHTNTNDFRDRELICEISLTRESVKVTSHVHTFQKLFFIRGNIKDNAIAIAKNKTLFLPATVAMIVKIILLWRSWTM